MISEAAKLATVRKANKAELAEFFDVSLPTIESWVRRGCPVVQQGRKGVSWVFDLRAAAKWRYGSDEQEENQDPDAMTPKDRKDWYDGEKRRREIQIQDGELILVADFDIEFSRLVKLTAGALETLPDLLERDAGLKGRQLAPVFKTIDGLRETLYLALTNREKPDV